MKAAGRSGAAALASDGPAPRHPFRSHRFRDHALHGPRRQGWSRKRKTSALSRPPSEAGGVGGARQAGSTRCSRSSSSSDSAGRRAPGSKGRARGTCTAFISPALGRALRIRDRCRFPGCDHRSYFHAHHARHWARGGATEIGNLVQLCSYHHRLVHEGGFRVEPDGLAGFKFRRPDGRPIADAPRCEVARGAGLVRQHLRAGLRLDGESCKPICAATGWTTASRSIR